MSARSFGNRHVYTPGELISAPFQTRGDHHRSREESILHWHESQRQYCDHDLAGFQLQLTWIRTATNAGYGALGGSQKAVSPKWLRRDEQ